MNDTDERYVCQTENREALEIKDVGAATKLTRGTALITPWPEQGPPPYNHWCPNC